MIGKISFAMVIAALGMAMPVSGATADVPSATPAAFAFDQVGFADDIASADLVTTATTTIDAKKRRCRRHCGHRRH